MAAGASAVATFTWQVPDWAPDHACLLALADEYGVDELVVVTITHSPKARLRSYELLAEAFGLERGGGEQS